MDLLQAARAEAGAGSAARARAARASMTGPRADAATVADLLDLAEQQSALRRVATVVARGAEPEELFDAIAAEASRLIGVDAISLISFDAAARAFTEIGATHGPRSAMTRGAHPLESSLLGKLIAETGQPARIDDWSQLPGPVAARHRAEGFGQAVGAPIIVDGAVWGYIGAYGKLAEDLPPGCADQLAEFTHLMAMAIANVQARDALRGLAEAQGALRRVATLVAQGAEPRVVFMAVATEAARLLRVEAVSLIRWDPQARLMTKIYGTHGQRAAVPDGGQWTLDDGPECALIVATLAPVRIDDWTVLPGPVVARHVASGFGQCVAAPLILDGELWGMISAFGEAGQVLPPGSEHQLADFTQLMVTAIANAEAREEVRAAAERQAALHRVATLVAQGAETAELFATIAAETSRLLGIANISMLRYDAQARTVTEISGVHHNPSELAGATLRLEDAPLGNLVISTGQPGRVDDWSARPGPAAAAHRLEGVAAAVGAPIIVDGTIWGYLGARVMAGEALPRDSENQLAEFTRLMAMAIANAQSRDKLRALAEQQGAALRRVATLVAQQAPPAVIFSAVAREASHALRVPRVDVVRCNPDGSLTPLGTSPADALPGGAGPLSRTSHLAGLVMATGRATRADTPVTSDVAAPITVDGATWGVIIVHADELLPGDTETRLTDFTHLVASSISNVVARDKLIVSRARIVSASDETRRRIERNIHDGVQQRILGIALALQAARTRSPLPPAAEAGLDEVASDLEAVLEEIRAFSRGLHPALLSRSGLGPALRDLARRSPIAVDVHAGGIGRLPHPVETAVYYVVCEALANAAKHSRADGVTVTVTADREAVRARVSDDGAGGASPGHGTGLIGLIDRVEALGGRLALDSPPGQGTTISVELPLAPQAIDGPPGR